MNTLFKIFILIFPILLWFSFLFESIIEINIAGLILFIFIALCVRYFYWWFNKSNNSITLFKDINVLIILLVLSYLVFIILLSYTHTYNNYISAGSYNYIIFFIVLFVILWFYPKTTNKKYLYLTGGIILCALFLIALFLMSFLPEGIRKGIYNMDDMHWCNHANLYDTIKSE